MDKRRINQDNKNTSKASKRNKTCYLPGSSPTGIHGAFCPATPVIPLAAQATLSLLLPISVQHSSTLPRWRRYQHCCQHCCWRCCRRHCRCRHQAILARRAGARRPAQACIACNCAVRLSKPHSGGSPSGSCRSRRSAAGSARRRSIGAPTPWRLSPSPGSKRRA